MAYLKDLHRRVRLGLSLLAAPTLVTGVWAVVAPASWYADYSHGIAPPSAFGNYNEHFVQDLGSGYLGLGTVLLLAAIWSQHRLVQAALAGFLVFTVPHFIIHIIEGGELSRGGYIFTNALLGLGVLLAVWVWSLNERRMRPAGEERHEIARGAQVPERDSAS